MAISAFLLLDEKKYNVLKFDYKLFRETKKTDKQEKVIKNPFEKYLAEQNLIAEREKFAAFEKDYSGEEKLKPFDEWAKDKQMEDKENEYYFPQSAVKGGFINFDIIAQPETFVVIHAWLLNLEQRKNGSFTFQLSIGGKKVSRTIGFSEAYCVKVKESFESQGKDQMLFKITICARLIKFGENTVFKHVKVLEEEEAARKKADEAKKQGEEEAQKLALTS